MRLTHMGVALFVMIVWGANFAIAKIGLQQLPPMLLMTIRFAAIAACMIPFVRFPRRSWPHYLGLSVTIGSLHYALMFSGLSRIDASTAAILIQLQVPFASILAAVFLKDRLGWRRSLGMAIAFVGVMMIVGQPKMGGDTDAIVMVLFAGFSWAAANLHIKLMGRHGLEPDPYALSAWVAAFAAPQLLILTLLMDENHATILAEADWRAWGSLAYMIFGVQIVAYSLWYKLLERYEVNQTMPWTLLAPICGMVAGVVMLGESMTWTVVLGAAVTLCGVAIIVVRRPKLAEPTVLDPGPDPALERAGER